MQEYCRKTVDIPDAHTHMWVTLKGWLGFSSSSLNIRSERSQAPDVGLLKSVVQYGTQHTGVRRENHGLISHYLPLLITVSLIEPDQEKQALISCVKNHDNVYLCQLIYSFFISPIPLISVTPDAVCKCKSENFRFFFFVVFYWSYTLYIERGAGACLKQLKSNKISNRL